MGKLRNIAVAATMFAPVALCSVNASAITLEEVTWTGEYAAETKTLALNNNVALDIEVKSGESSILDLSSYNLNNYTAACSTIYVEEGGSLTLKGTGTVSSIDNSTAATVYNAGTLTIEGGSYTQASNAVAPVIYNTGTLTIKNGTFSAVNTATGKYTPVVANIGGTVTIKDGAFSQAGHYYVIQTEGGSTNIEGGTFNSEAGDTGVIGNIKDTNSNITISGGTFNEISHYAVIDYPGNTLAITGGEFNGKIYAPGQTGFISGTATFAHAFSADNAETSEHSEFNMPAYLAEGLVAVPSEIPGLYELVELEDAIGQVIVADDEDDNLDADVDEEKEIIKDLLVEYLNDLYTGNEPSIEVDFPFGIRIHDWDLDEDVEYDSLLDAVLAGNQVTVWVFQVELEGDLEEHDTSAEELESAIEGSKFMSLYDISISISVGDANGYVSNLGDDSLQFVLTASVEDLPEVPEGATRSFHVVRLHYGEEPEEIESEATMSEDGKSVELAFESSKYSYFAIVYLDTIANVDDEEPTEDPTTPATEDGTSSATTGKGMEGDGAILEEILASASPSKTTTTAATTSSTTVASPNTGLGFAENLDTRAKTVAMTPKESTDNNPAVAIILATSAIIATLGVAAFELRKKSARK